MYSYPTSTNHTPAFSTCPIWPLTGNNRLHICLHYRHRLPWWQAAGHCHQHKPNPKPRPYVFSSANISIYPLTCFLHCPTTGCPYFFPLADFFVYPHCCSRSSLPCYRQQKASRAPASQTKAPKHTNSLPDSLYPTITNHTCLSICPLTGDQRLHKCVHHRHRSPWWQAARHCNQPDF